MSANFVSVLNNCCPLLSCILVVCSHIIMVLCIHPNITRFLSERVCTNIWGNVFKFPDRSCSRWIFLFTDDRYH